MRPAVAQIERDRRLRQRARAHTDAGGGTAKRFSAIGGNDEPYALLPAIML